jgi:integrase
MNKKLSGTAIAVALLKHRSGLVTTKSNEVFDSDADVWKFRVEGSTASLDFTQFSFLSPGLQGSLKSTMTWFAENHSADYLQNLHGRMLHFVRHMAATKGATGAKITNAAVLNYKSSLDAATEYYLGVVKVLLEKWHRLGYPGIEKDVISLFKEVRIKGNPKGVAVQTMDPLMGPYTNIELEAIQSAVNEAYAVGTLNEAMYLLSWLFMALGQRPTQYAALKVCDVTSVPLADGTVTYLIQMPRAKQRNAGIRSAFKVRELVPQIGKPLLDYAERVALRYVGVLADPSTAPLFPQTKPTNKGGQFAYHQAGATLGKSMAAALEALSAQSERTGDALNIAPVRFRRTFGTRAAQQGHGELVIAELLDHSDTQNVGVYVASVPEISARIDKAIAMHLAPLAQAFQGVLIETEQQATRGSDPSSRVVDLRIDKKAPMGSCGQFSFCGFNAPVACYTCKSFQPWLDGPHDAVLDKLLERRERLLNTSGPTIVSINDRTILAIAEVIQLCRDFRKKRAQ